MQRTLREPVSFRGRGLHTGAAVTLRVEPAPVDHGLSFVRTDLNGAPEGRVGPAAATESRRCMRLQWYGSEGVAAEKKTEALEVLTPEHVLAACGGLGLTNARLCLEGPEVPILDGSAAPFATAFAAAGLVDQGRAQSVLRLTVPVVVHEGDALVLVRPADAFSITYVASYPHAMVGTQVYEYTASTDFLSQLAPARTFGFAEEVEALRAQGLIGGGSLECAVLIMPDGYSSPLRFSDEFVRHKTLDLLGDLTVLGQTLAAHVVAVRSSHRLHARLLRALVATSPSSPQPELVRRTP